MSVTKKNKAGELGACFVTGATGLLGTELVSQLLSSGEATKVVCLVRDHLPSSRFFTAGLANDPRVVVVHGDVRDEKLLDRSLNEYEIGTVFHLAAQTLVGHANRRPTETLDVNIRGTWGLLEAVRNQPGRQIHTLVASSDKAYGDLNGGSYDETFPLAGKHPYDVSKSCVDLISQAYAHSYKTPVSIARCGNFFGPGDLNENRIFPSTILSVLKGERPQLRSNGKYVRDYIYVADGAAAYRTLALRMKRQEPYSLAYNFSYGLKLSVLAVVDAILKAMNSSLEPQILDDAPNEIPFQSLDSSLAKKELNWTPQFGFEEGVTRTIAWYREQFEKTRGGS